MINYFIYEGRNAKHRERHKGGANKKINQAVSPTYKAESKYQPPKTTSLP